MLSKIMTAKSYHWPTETDMLVAASYGQSSIQMEPQHQVLVLDLDRLARGDGSSPRREWRSTHFG